MDHGAEGKACCGPSRGENPGGEAHPFRRVPGAAAAGMVLIPRSVFYFWTAIGSAIWLSFLAIAGYMLEDHYEDVQGWVEPLAWVVVGGSILAYGLHLIHALRRAKQRRDQA